MLQMPDGHQVPFQEGAHGSPFGLPNNNIPLLALLDQEPLNEVFTSFLNAKRNLIVQGVPVEDVLGDPDVNAGALYGTQHTPDAHPMSAWAAGLVTTFQSLGLHERWGIMHLVLRLMRVRTLPPSKAAWSVADCSD